MQDNVKNDRGNVIVSFVDWDYDKGDGSRFFTFMRIWWYLLMFMPIMFLLILMIIPLIHGHSIFIGDYFVVAILLSISLWGWGIKQRENIITLYEHGIEFRNTQRRPYFKIFHPEYRTFDSVKDIKIEENVLFVDKKRINSSEYFEIIMSTCSKLDEEKKEECDAEAPLSS